MRTFRAGSSKVLALGGGYDAVVDRFYYGQYGTPAVLPNPVLSAALVPYSDPAWSYSGTWTNGATTTPGSVASFTFTGFAVQVQLQLSSLGGIAFLDVDGAPRLALDTSEGVSQAQLLFPWMWGPAPTENASIVVLAPSGGQHTLHVYYYGDIASTINPIGAPANTVGTSVAALLQPMRMIRGATVSQTVTIVALDAQHVSINGAGSYALGTTVTGVIAGVALTLNSGSMTAGDTATFQTQATGITVAGANVASSFAADGSFTTPVIAADGTALPFDGTAAAPLPLPMPEPYSPLEPLQWLLLTWEENPVAPVQAGWASTGNAKNPADPTWKRAGAVGPWDGASLPITHDGLGTGCMGMAAMPMGAYCQAQVSVPPGGFARNFRFYAWNPATDPARHLFLPWPDGDFDVRVYGALAAFMVVATRDPVRELVKSYSPGASVGRYADLKGAEWGLPRPMGLDDDQYAAFLRGIIQSRTTGATLAFAQRALALVLGAGVPFSVTPINGVTSTWQLGISTLGVDTYLGPVTQNAWQAVIQIKVAAMYLPPQVVQQIIESFRTVGVNLLWLWT